MQSFKEMTSMTEQEEIVLIQVLMWDLYLYHNDPEYRLDLLLSLSKKHNHQEVYEITRNAIETLDNQFYHGENYHFDGRIFSSILKSSMEEIDYVSTSTLIDKTFMFQLLSIMKLKAPQEIFSDFNILKNDPNSKINQLRPDLFN